MRIAILGASAIAVATARMLLQRKHDVVLIERSKEIIEELGESLPCGFIHGNGTRPAILKEVGPDRTHLLLCLTNNDETNIIASLVGRSLGFGRVVTRIEDPEFEHICIELGLEDTIIPNLTIGRYLAGMASGQDILELSGMIREPVRFFGFVAREQDEGPIRELHLPRRSRAIYFYRGEEFRLADGHEVLQKDDEVVVVTHEDDLPELLARWASPAV